MTVMLYNSATRREEAFAPPDPERIGVYACGPTVYDRAHVGNFRMLVVFDLLVRVLRYAYGKDSVTYVRNITDIDDRIIAKAAKNGETIDQVSERYTSFFHQDAAALNCAPPDIEPRATGHVPEMIAMILRLLESGHAYEAERHVLFAVSGSPGYGALSGRSRDEQIAGARVEIAPYKRDPADFVLWKPSPPDFPGWDSPWGRGRPGWHIECSAMSAKHLGRQFDIHGGGIDLIFPHHENEVAQSSAANGVAPARVWMHNGHLMVAGQKMSKSLGNFTTLEQLLRRWPGEAIRVALLSSHYRQPLDMTEELLAASRARLDYMYGVLRRRSAVGSGAVVASVEAALQDELNTPQALSSTHELAQGVEAGTAGSDTLLASGDLLGILQHDPEEWFRWQPPDAVGLGEAEIDALIEDRKHARARRDFAESDRIRAGLLASGVLLEDTPQGTFWRRAGP